MKLSIDGIMAMHVVLPVALRNTNVIAILQALGLTQAP